MSDRFLYESVGLMLPAGVEDGAVRYRTITAHALMLREFDTLPGMPQGADIRAELLLQSPVPPTAGTRIRRGGGLLQISSVRPCRAPDGTLRGYRCEVLKV